MGGRVRVLWEQVTLRLRGFPYLQKMSPLWILFALIVIIAAISYGRNERLAILQHRTTNASWSLIARAVSESDHLIGDPQAPVQVIVFSDLSCRYCKSFFSSTLSALQKRFGEDIVVAYRHMPLPSHPEAFLEAEASECISKIAGEEHFWEFVSAVYAEPGYEEGLKQPVLARIAKTTGVETEDFDSCIRSGTGAERVKEDSLEAAIAGLSITPSFVIKSSNRGVIVQGNYYSQIEAAISYALETRPR